MALSSCMDVIYSAVLKITFQIARYFRCWLVSPSVRFCFSNKSSYFCALVNRVKTSKQNQFCMWLMKVSACFQQWFILNSQFVDLEQTIEICFFSQSNNNINKSVPLQYLEKEILQTILILFHSSSSPAGDLKSEVLNFFSRVLSLSLPLPCLSHKTAKKFQVLIYSSNIDQNSRVSYFTSIWEENVHYLKQHLLCDLLIPTRIGRKDKLFQKSMPIDQRAISSPIRAFYPL